MSENHNCEIICNRFCNEMIYKYSATSDRDHYFFSQQYFKQSVVFLLGGISPTSNSEKNNLLLILLSLMPFLFKLLHKRKCKHNFLNVSNFYITLLFLTYIALINNPNSSLKNCTKR